MVMMASLNIVRVWVQITMRIGVPGARFILWETLCNSIFCGRPERLPATRKTVLDLHIFGPHISSLSPWRNRRNVYLNYNQSEKMRGDPRITRSPNKKRKKRKDEKKRKRRQRRKPRRMKDERNRQSIGENKLPTHRIGHTQTPGRKQSPLRDETP